MWIHSMSVDQLLDYNQLTIEAGQKEAVQVILHMEIGGTADYASVQLYLLTLSLRLGSNPSSSMRYCTTLG